MQKDKQLLNLAQVRKEHDKDKSPAEHLRSTIGLIVDCSNVYKYEKNRDHTQKFKIIDSTNTTEPVQVFIWSQRRDDFTTSIKVGDILLLNNFKFQTYNGNLQAKKAYKAEDSYYRIFSGNPEVSNYNTVDRKVGLDDEDGKILTALNHLRAFSKTYLSKNRVPVLFKENKKTGKVTSSDFDAIMRVTESVEMPNHFKLKLTNEKDQFCLNYVRHVPAGVYKIRSIADVTWQDKICYLSGNDYTFFLEVSPWMLSYNPKEWDRVVSTPETTSKKSRRPKIESRVIGAAKKTKLMSLKDLFSGDDHKEDVRVICEVMDVCTPFEDALKKYDSDNNTQKSKISQTGDYIYSIHLLLSDASLEGQVINAYIYTFDGKGLEFLPELQPSRIFGRNTLDFKENYDNFVNRVLEESDIDDVPLELILSPLFNGRETIYRIVDTMLLF